MNHARSMIGLIVGASMVMASYVAERERRDQPEVEVVLGLDDGLPDRLRSGRSYHATLTVEWTGSRSERDGPERDGPERDGPERDGPERDGPERDGPERDGPERDGMVSVYVSRRDGGAEVDTDERWPLVCASAYDDAIGAVQIRCPFEAPSPGEFALLLEVVGDDGSPIGEGLYAHEVVP